MTELAILFWIIAAILTVSGFAGLLLPIVPGAPLLFLGLFFGAWAEDFHYVGGWYLLLFAGMAALTYVVEVVTSVLGVKKYGGSSRAMAGAVVGGFIGLFFGLPGILIAPFLGAVAGELSLQRSLDQASRAGFGTVVGMAIGVAGKLAIGIAMVGLFLIIRLF